MKQSKKPGNRAAVGPWVAAADELGELFFPRFCAVCRAHGEVMRGRSALCPACSQLIGMATLNVRVTSLPFSPCPVVTAGEYEYELARCLLAFKNSGRLDLRPYLSSALARSISLLCSSLGEGCYHQLPKRQLLLVPIPSSRASVRRRGFEPAAELTFGAEKTVLRALPGVKVTTVEALRPLFPWEAGPGALSAGNHRSQKQLGRQERLAKMKGSLTIRQPALHWAGRSLDLSGYTCVICDDVATTGASIAEAVRVLQQAGATVLGAATVARVPRRDAHRGRSASDTR